jgi:hypothetical protein
MGVLRNSDNAHHRCELDGITERFAPEWASRW